MKYILVVTMLMILLLSACTTNPANTEQTPPDPTQEVQTPSATVPVSTAPTETPITGMGQPVDMDIVPESTAEWLFDTDWYYGYLPGEYAMYPDISAATDATLVRAILEGSHSIIMLYYAVEDVPAAIDEYYNILLSAGFVPISEVGAELDFHTPPESGDIVLSRGSDIKWVSLQETNGELEIRYALNTSYEVGEEYIWLDRTGDDGSGYTGPLFNDGGRLQDIVRIYCEVPDPGCIMSYPRYHTTIEPGTNRITLKHKTYLPDVRVESFRMSYEDVGFTTEYFSIERSVYTKDNIRVTVLFEKEFKDYEFWYIGTVIMEMI